MTTRISTANGRATAPMVVTTTAETVATAPEGVGSESRLPFGLQILSDRPGAGTSHKTTGGMNELELFPSGLSRAV